MALEGRKRIPAGPWEERQWAYQDRIMREEAEESQASHALTLHQAARAVDALAGCTQPEFLRVLEEHDEIELEALQSLIEGYLQDRKRRESNRHQSEGDH